MWLRYLLLNFSQVNITIYFMISIKSYQTDLFNNTIKYKYNLSIMTLLIFILSLSCNKKLNYPEYSNLSSFAMEGLNYYNTNLSNSPTYLLNLKNLKLYWANAQTVNASFTRELTSEKNSANVSYDGSFPLLIDSWGNIEFFEKSISGSFVKIPAELKLKNGKCKSPVFPTGLN
jgi:hypothetical protein